MTTAKEEAGVPPKSTVVVPVKLLPEMVTVAPGAALAGVNELMMGAVYVNPGDTAVPNGVVTTMLPVAPRPTTAVIVVLLTTVYEAAGTPPKVILYAPDKFVPLMVTTVPLTPLVGVKELMAGTR